VNYPYLGMGIAFVDMSAENQEQLTGLLSTISRPTVVMGPRVAASLPPGGRIGCRTADRRSLRRSAGTH
jgi:hypothetical protein